MPSLLELDALRCVRGDRLLFDGVSAAVPAGRLLRVGGANGAGKTSLLRMVCGLGVPASGVVRWRGQDVARLRDRFHAELVYLGHAPALKDELSTSENLRTACRLVAVPCSAEDAGAALGAAGLRGREHLPARALSQGQRKRAVLARLALSAGAALWVLDEPFSALDDSAVAWLQSLIRLHLARGGIVVLTGHDAHVGAGLPVPIEIALTPSPVERLEAVE